MNLVGVPAHGVELATLLASLLQRHNYISQTPVDLDALLAAGRAATQKEPEPAFVVLQEGGSSSEALSIHSHRTRKEAERDQADCCENGSYQTSPVIEIPGTIAVHGELLYQSMDHLLRGAQELDYRPTAPTKTPKQPKP